MKKHDAEELKARKLEAMRVIHENADSPQMRAVRDLLDCFEFDATDGLKTLIDPPSIYQAQGSIKGLDLLRMAMTPAPVKQAPAEKKTEFKPSQDGGGY